jgi:hypothetical protein
MSAPERIWATGNATSGSWNDRQLTNARIDYDEKLYIRADLAPQWQDIATAPKDGTDIFIYRKDWDCAPVAQWMDYPSNPVLDASGDYSWMQGWGHDTMFFCVGEEDYWLGWDGDPMPTHWMPLPTSPEPAP